MSKHSHVPKFGNWDKEDHVPYTTYFENARKDKAGVRMNPNDPEENPEAFMSGRSDGDARTIGSPLHVDYNKHNLAERHHIEGHNPQGRNTFDHQQSERHKGIVSESSSDKSNSDISLMKPGNQRQKSDRRKSPGEGSNSFSSSVPGHYRQRSGNHPSAETHHRAPSVPKFGAWDETDPKSGEGFTVIFEKVKEEKQISSAKFPAPPTQQASSSDGQRNNKVSSSGSKRCCCLFW